MFESFYSCRQRRCLVRFPPVFPSSTNVLLWIYSSWYLRYCEFDAPILSILCHERVERTLASTVHLDYIWHCFARCYFYRLWKQRNTFLLLSIATRTIFIRVLGVRARVTRSIFSISQFLTFSEETAPVLALLSSTIDELAVYLSLQPMSRLGFVLARNFVD